jgi:serine/threonine protein kinase
MTAERWRRVRELLYHASALAPAARVQYLGETCAGDPELRTEVERLLTALEESGSFLEPAGPAAQEPVETKIGPYRILNEAGRGGMGVVYRAVRDDEYRQQVAVKLVKRDMETDFLLARFRQERQALALLNHANIARLLDGGTTADGRPYLVMEWVEGQPVTEYCAAHSPPLRRRLELFLDVCEAVAHAHRNLVVHRDLKPSNILITAEGRPKLLDFGIAKIFSPSPDDIPATMTMAGARALTPEYASPEQVRGEPVTTATDIYSLGAVLYELLTGNRPHRLETRTPPEIERVVCTQQVVRPSSATGAAGIPVQELRCDLDNIILKALEKEPARRYSHVDEFSADVRRHLEGRPVLARPDSVWYRVSKFTRRNRLLVGAVAAVAIALAAGTVVSLWQASVARRERAVAERRFELARRLAGSLLYDIHDEVSDLAGATKARELLLKRSLEYLDALSKEASSSTPLQRDLANAYERAAALQGMGGVSNLGNTDAARHSLRMALALRQTVLLSDPSSVEFRRELARTHREFASLEEDGTAMLQHAQASLALVEQLVREKPEDRRLLLDRATAEYSVARATTSLSRFPEAIDFYRRALSHSASSSPGDVALYHKRLGAVLAHENDLTNALKEYQAAAVLDEERVRANPDNGRAKMDLSYDYSDWGFVLQRMNSWKPAVEQYRKAEKIRAEMVQADPRDARAAGGLVSIHWRLARALADAGERRESEATFLKAIHAGEAMVRRFPDRRTSLDSLADACLAFAYCWKDKWSSCAQARAWLTRARDLYRELKNTTQVAEIESELAKLCLKP